MPPSFHQDLLEAYLADLCRKQKDPSFDRLQEEFFVALRYLRRKKPMYAQRLREEEGALDLLHDCVAELLSQPTQDWPRGSILRLVGRKAYASFERKAQRTLPLDPSLHSAPLPCSWTDLGGDSSLVQAVFEPGIRKGSGGVHFERLRLSMTQDGQDSRDRAPTRRGLRARLRALTHRLGRDPRYQAFWLSRLGEVLLALSFRALEAESHDLLPGSPPTPELHHRLDRILLQMRQLQVQGSPAQGLKNTRMLHRAKDYSRPRLRAALADLPHPQLGALALRIEEARLNGDSTRALRWSPAPEDLYKLKSLPARQSLLLQRARLHESAGNPSPGARLLERFLPSHRSSPLFLYNLWSLSHQANLPWIRRKALDALHRLPAPSLHKLSPILRHRIHHILHRMQP